MSEPSGGGTAPQRFLLLVYRMPAKPTAGRVAVWRNLKKIGAVYLQDSVCVIPDTAAQRRELAPVLERIDVDGGRYHLLPLRKLPPDEEEKLRRALRRAVGAALPRDRRELRGQLRQGDRVRALPPELHLRGGGGDPDGVRQDLHLVRARARSATGSAPPTATRRATWLRRCESLLEEFEAKVFEVNATDADEPAARARALERVRRLSAPLRRRAGLLK